MTVPKVKICGLRDAHSARVAEQSGADFVGLVFVCDSPRAVSIEQAATIAASLTRAAPVGLFVDRPAEEILHIARIVGLSFVQLHGHETPDAVRALGPLRVFKALAFGVDPLEPWAAPIDNLHALLLDAPRGGSGASFDWQALAHTAIPRDFMLAGGLTPDNVASAVNAVRPWGVDVSSGVESVRGVKDPARIRAFCAAARQGANS